MKTMSDIELHALAILVQAEALMRRSVDEDRLANGCSVAYGDLPIRGAAELDAELKRRGVLS